MEQATDRHAAARRRSAPRLPPGSRMPAALQALRYARDPLGFLIRLQRRYGDVFTVSLPLLRPPRLRRRRRSWSNRSSPAPPAQMHAGEANATVLEPALGPNSVLTLDDGPAHAPAQTAAAALPRRAHRRLRRADARGHPAGDGELAGRRALRAAPPHAADHPGGDHARRLRRPRRGAAHPLRRPDRELQPPRQRRDRLPAACAATSAAQPLGAIPARAGGARRVHLRGDRAAPRRGRGRARTTTTCSPCCSQPATTTAAR